MAYAYNGSQLTAHSSQLTPIIVIFSGYNQRAVTAFLRTLTSLGINRYVIIADSLSDRIFMSSYSDRIIFVREDARLSLELFGKISGVVKQLYGEDSSRLVIAPATEFLNRYILSFRADLERMGYIVPLANKALYETVSDKKTFSDLCRQNGLDVPEELPVPQKYSVPFAAKPIKYINSAGKIYSPVLVKSHKDFVQFISEYDTEDFYIQEFVTGRNLYLLLYLSSDGKVYSLSQTNLIQQDNGKSIIAAEINNSFYAAKYADRIRDLFRSINFTGLVMIEVREHGNRNCIIEANPRFWGPSQLFVDAGYNFFHAMLRDWGFSCPEPDINSLRPETKYFWEGGLSQDSIQNKHTVFFENMQERFIADRSEFERWEIYKRSDTIKIWEAENE